MRKVLIIGGSKGIGFATLKRLIDTHEVINISRSTPTITHQNLSHFSLNVIEDELPTIDNIDTLVYCPGSINLKPIQRLSLEDFTNDLEINLLGAIKVIKKYLGSLKKGKHASIILFSTVATKLGMPFHTSIAASKSAVEGLTKSLAAELTPTIRVNAIAPTVTDTGLAKHLLKSDKFRESIKQRHPLKNHLEPDEIAEFICYLQSEKAKALSGQIFNFDYGIVSLKL